MKHSVAVKFLAIFLCALTLLGAAGSAAGILVMTEMDLYNRTVAQVKEQRLQELGQSFAQDHALYQAGLNLGGCSEEILSQITGKPGNWFYNLLDPNYFGYRLLDESGNVLLEQNPEFADHKKASAYTFPISGEYVQLLSTYPKAQEVNPKVPELPYLQNNVPENGVAIRRLLIKYNDGETVEITDGTLANAYYADYYEDQLLIDPTHHYGDMHEDVPILYLAAWDVENNLVYEAGWTGGIGSFTMSNAYGFVFLPSLTEETDTPVTLGETTIFVDDINPDGHGIYGYNILYTDGHGHDLYSQKMIGSAYRPNASELVINLNHRAESPYPDIPIQTLILYGMDNEVIYHAYNPTNLGSFTPVENGHTFTFAPTATDIPTEKPYLYDAIPPEGCEVYGLNYSTGDSSTGVGSVDPIGFLYYGDGGRVMFRSYSAGLVEMELSGVMLTSISFLDENNQAIYEATDAGGVGFFNQDGTSKDIFHSTVFSDHKANGDILDSEGNVIHSQTATAEVWTAYFLDENRNILYQAASFDVPVGTFFYDGDGYAHLSLDLSQPASYTVHGQLHQAQIVCGVSLYGLQGQPLYDGFHKEGLGTITLDRDLINYRSYTPDPAPIATPAVIYDDIPPMEQVTEEYVETTAATEETTATTPETVPESTVPSSASAPLEATTVPTEPVLALASPNAPNDTFEYYDPQTNQWMVAEITYEQLPNWTMEMYLLPGAYAHEALYELLETMQLYRRELFILLAVSGLLCAMLFVYLCCAAGRKPGSSEVRAGGLNCLPLDLYTGVTVGLMIAIIYYGAEGTVHLLNQKMEVGFIFGICMAFLGCLVIVGYLYGFVAQIKTPRRYWLKNTLVARFIRFTFRSSRNLETWLSRKGFPFVGRTLKKLWHFSKKALLWCYRTCETALMWVLTRIGRIFRWIGKKIRRFLSLLPLTWQWLLMGFTMIFVLLLSIDSFKDGNDIALPIGLAITIGIVIYAAHCFGVLSESTKRMGKGDLDTKVEDKLLIGCFEDFAQDLNALADVAVVAAQKQLKSERMKTELITNVSHDIKTPLTSIINYVDLLQKPHTEQQQEQYLEVLDRQSQRLKKLIVDLMDMSKASTGNMSVEIMQLDAIESVNQALGEFSDKLARAQLTPVFRHTEDSAPILADGRLVWRVMSNLLSNAVKYAMPGTRLYIDLMTVDGKVVLSFKNISREELNLDAEELMERFVRGDDSRNTEGSGLGLNIARSLMELQKGQLQLLVDGDLFKVTLIFPGT